MGLNLENVEFIGKRRGTKKEIGAVMRIAKYPDKVKGERITIAIYSEARSKYNLLSYRGLYVASQKNHIILKPSNSGDAYFMSKAGSGVAIQFNTESFDYVMKDSVYIFPEHISVQNGYIVIDYMSALDKETSNEIASVKLTKQQFIDKELKSAYYYVSQGVDAHNQPIQSTNAYLSGARTRAERDWILYSKEN